MRHLHCATLAVAGALVAATPAAAHQTAATPTIPSKCMNQAVAPASMVLACADGGIVAHDLQWTDWGAPQTHATGTATVNDCDPDCADGTFREHPIAITARRLRQCPEGRPQYTRVSYVLSDTDPSSDGFTLKFPCYRKPRPKPRLKKVTMRLVGHHPGRHYYVNVRLGLRVCEQHGTSQAIFDETLRLGRHTFAEHIRSRRFRQRHGCQWHHFRWRLQQKFFGIGRYRVSAFVYDRDYEWSKTKSVSYLTTD